mmetsp:Transcript_11317/g.20799  ORF Transcript_11317/g.20799 Transcript_11317/m.20799 type:complete len:357 (-) Transcript_11317:71-1141(-)|eukprot:CAMPEP_0201910682 /NCGR_PEP_ID=MMETSP0903-20130614/1967_1 /ASSEMBLY_ACC=CAM_ASM_000552 /TAXON_ID=420261 /ORGANISM="Thalassiosira antarctica, Strain CCMP982" /LENGTH=356 /DNA_ID=CAMNT_0048445353 /DNA_START=239 /DNA_END=1309 /DNA_ORIENTATION=-
MGRKSKRRGKREKQTSGTKPSDDDHSSSGSILNNKLERERSDEMEELLKKDGDIEGQLRLCQWVMRALDMEANKLLSKEGRHPMPPQDDPFIGTLVDDDLFVPCPPRPDCPICFLPLPDRTACTYQPCCGKTACDGCIHAHRDACTDYCCPFCRSDMQITDMERIKQTEKRIELNNDGEAFYMIGACYLTGESPMKQDDKKAIELLSRAAELGSEAAHHTLGVVYAQGRGVGKNEKKAMYHLRIAAIGGVLESRYILGLEANRPDWFSLGTKQQGIELAMKHLIIAAEAGHDDSLKSVKSAYAQGYVMKYVFAKVLRAHQAVQDYTKSDARDKAAKYWIKNDRRKKTPTDFSRNKI